jgi:hypothetical protein
MSQMSWVSCRHLIFGSTAFFALAIAQPSSSQCPSGNGKRVSDGGYTFVYDSVVYKNKFGSQLIRCIQNLTDQDMYIRWEGIPIEGYARPKGRQNSIIEHSIPIVNDSVIEKSSALWFGTDRYKTNAPFLTPINSSLSNNTNLPFLTTHIKISVPNDLYDPALGFFDLDLTINSTGDSYLGGKDFIYRLSANQKNYSLEWYSEAVVVTPGKLSLINPLTFGKKLPTSSSTLSSSIKEWAFLQKGKPKAVVQPLILTDKNGIPAGNAQIALYRPNE